MDQLLVDTSNMTGLDPWFELAKASALTALVFYLVVIERPRIEKRIDDNNLSFRQDILNKLTTLTEKITAIERRIVNGHHRD